MLQKYHIYIFILQGAEWWGCVFVLVCELKEWYYWKRKFSTELHLRNVTKQPQYVDISPTLKVPFQRPRRYSTLTVMGKKILPCMSRIKVNQSICCLSLFLSCIFSVQQKGINRNYLHMCIERCVLPTIAKICQQILKLLGNLKDTNI